MRIIKSNIICEPLTYKPGNKKFCNMLFIEREQNMIEDNPDGIYGLQKYFEKAAWEEDKDGYVKIYILKRRFTNELIGYFGLKTGLICIDSEYRNAQREEAAKEKSIKLFPTTIPGIEISHFAINDIYRKKYSRNGKPLKGLGRYIYPTFIYPIIKKTSELVGIKIAYLNSVDETGLADYYQESFGFTKTNSEDSIIAIQPYYDDGCTFMYKIIN